MTAPSPMPARERHRIHAELDILLLRKGLLGSPLRNMYDYEDLDDNREHRRLGGRA